MQGAEIVSFSPTKDELLPADIDGLYFGGGYPEIYAQNLAENTAMRNQIKKESINGMPIYAECGGFMYLCKGLTDLKEKHFPMVGCFPFETKMFSKLKALGYREITLTADTIIGNTGQIIRGHEFHYSELVQSASDFAAVYRITDRSGMDKSPGGYFIHQTLGSYNHLHFGSNPQSAAVFIEKCLSYRQKRMTASAA